MAENTGQSSQEGPQPNSKIDSEVLRAVGITDFSIAGENAKTGDTSSETAINDESSTVVEYAGPQPFQWDSRLLVPLVPDEYFWFDPRTLKIRPIGNDPIAFAHSDVIPALGDVSTSTVTPPSTPTDQTPPEETAVQPEQGDVTIAETNSPSGSYALEVVRGDRPFTSIPAPINGTVVSTGYADDLGNYVLIRGSDGIAWRMAHLDSVGVTRGQQVRRGRPIGNQGTSGSSPQQGVHIEILHRVGRRQAIIEDRLTTRPMINNYGDLIQGSNSNVSDGSVTAQSPLSGGR
jgi:hypothetical protein